MSGSLATWSVGVTARKPPPSRARPLSLNQSGGAASVASKTASAAKVMPPRQTTEPALSAVAIQYSLTATPPKCPLDAGAVGFQHGFGRHQGKRNAGFASVARRISIEARAQGEQQLDAGGTSPDHGDAPYLAGAAPGAQLLKLRQEHPDGLDRDAVFGGARNGCQTGRYANVDRENIVGDGQPVGEQHTLGAAVEPDCLCMDKAGSGHGGQPDEIDMRLLRSIEARNNARQHRGIGCFQIAGDQRHSDARQRPVREGPDDVRMGMAAAEQHDIRRDVDAAVHDWPVRTEACNGLRRSPWRRVVPMRSKYSRTWIVRLRPMPLARLKSAAANVPSVSSVARCSAIRSNSRSVAGRK